jgi:hypothetical protein
VLVGGPLHARDPVLGQKKGAALKRTTSGSLFKA